jgi:hypothetical protein
MSKRISDHLRTNVVGYIALFLFATSGTALALAGSNTVFSDDIVNQEVKTDDIENGGVGIADLGVNSVGSGELNDGSVKSAEINDETIVSADVLNGSLTGGDIQDSSLTGADVADNSLTGNDISDGLRASASTTGGGCNDDDANGETCATTNITLGETSKLLVNATGGWHSHGTSGGMSCRLDHDGIETIGAAQQIGEAGSNHPLGTADGTMALTGISADIGPGTHAISLICTQNDADLDITNSNLTVVAVDE